MTSTFNNQPRLIMSGISKSFGKTIALGNVSFEVKPGEIHAIVGENGAGKSTLMKVLSGAVIADEGTMRLDNENFNPKNPLEARHKGIGMIYQELSLAPHLTVEENLLLGMEPVKFGFVQWKDVRKRTLQVLAHLKHPEIKADVPCGNLSLAARQLVEIGRALVVGCGVLVFDEPTSSLSGDDIETLFKIIRELKLKGIAIIYISHFLEEVTALADRITIMRDGNTISTHNVSDVSHDQITSLMVGREVANLYPRSPHKQGEPMLELKDIAGIKKPENASLVLHSGEVFGIFGLLGAGRTELIRAIFGLDPIRKGKLKIGSFSGFGTPVDRWRQGVGMLSEDRKDEGLALNLTVADNITLSKMSGLGTGPFVTPLQQKKAADIWIDQLDIRCQDAHQMLFEISGGNQQKVALARLLHHDVDILLLDEPTRGIDVAAKATIYEAIDNLVSSNHENNPKCILMISSYLPELLGVCDRIAVMTRGRLSKAHDVKDVNEHELMLFATGSQNLFTDENKN